MATLRCCWLAASATSTSESSASKYERDASRQGRSSLRPPASWFRGRRQGGFQGRSHALQDPYVSAGLWAPTQA